MSNRRDCRGVQIMGICEHCALFEQSCQPGMVLGSKTKQVIVAKLVDDDGHHEARLARRRGGRGESACYKKRKN
jgi:hypothetical protein